MHRIGRPQWQASWQLESGINITGPSQSSANQKTAASKVRVRVRVSVLSIKGSMINLILTLILTMVPNPRIDPLSRRRSRSGGSFSRR